MAGSRRPAPIVRRSPAARAPLLPLLRHGGRRAVRGSCDARARGLQRAWGLRRRAWMRGGMISAGGKSRSDPRARGSAAGKVRRGWAPEGGARGAQAGAAATARVTDARPPRSGGRRTWSVPEWAGEAACAWAGRGPAGVAPVVRLKVGCWDAGAAEQQAQLPNSHRGRRSEQQGGERGGRRAGVQRAAAARARARCACCASRAAVVRLICRRPLCPLQVPDPSCMV